MRRLTYLIALVCLCTGFEWPGRLPHLVYQSAHGSQGERRDAVRQLAQYPVDGVRDALLLALEDDELDVRLEAAAALGRLHVSEAVPVLMEWLDEKSPELRINALTALGAIGDGRAQTGLVRALSDSAASVRCAAVAALTKPTDEARAALLPSLDDADSGVRKLTALALGDFPAIGTLHALANHARDESAEVRAAVLRALGRLQDARAVPALTGALADGDEAVQLAALVALGDSNSPAAVSTLRDCLKRAPRLAKTALAALGRIDDPSATQTLIEALAQAELGPSAAFGLLSNVRRACSRAGNSQPALSPIAALSQALANSTAPEHTTLLADTLSQLSNYAPITPAVEPLLAALAERRGATSSLTRALALSAAPELLPALLERLARAEASELDPVLDALGLYLRAGLGDGRAAEPLLARLNDAKGEARLKLLRLVGLSHAGRALPALAQALTSANPIEQRIIVEAIGELHAVESKRTLWPLLEAPDAMLRLTAARALATSADAATVRELASALRSPSALDRNALLLALGASLARLSQTAKLDAPLRAELLPLLATFSAASDEALSARAVDALRSLHDQSAMAVIARLLRAPSARRRSIAVFAFADFPHDDTRRVLRFMLQHDNPRVGTAAALALGEVGDQRDAAALTQTAQRALWPLSAAATFALARMAQRGATKKHSLQRLLCTLSNARDGHVLANVATGLAAVGARGCEDANLPLTWLDPSRPSALRVAAALWARTLAAQGDGSEPTRDPALARALLSCADDPDAQVAQACQAHPASAAARSRFDVDAYAPDGQTLLRERLVALRLPDGSVLVAYTDANGRVVLPAAQSGEFILEDPANAGI